MRVASLPAKPVLIWDGECGFCERCVERWRAITGDDVEYLPYQELGDRFPEISRDQFQRSIVYVDRSGEVSFAAEAAYRSLGCRSSKRWMAWCYDHVPGFAAISEFGYEVLSANRALASAMTRFLWGNDVRPPTYFLARKWFLRVLGLIYICAFVSLWIQVDGLVGSNGILPIADFLAAAREQIGGRAVWMFPTLCWIDGSNAFLHFLCGGGIVLAFLLLFGIAPALSLGALFVFYLSLTIAGQTFLSFQWDILLLETGFLAIFLAPWRLWPGRKSVAAAGPAVMKGEDAGDTPAATEEPINRVGFFLLKFLLFKLMLMSGVVKLTSGDDSWWNLTALDFHYWSQPLPTGFGWWADKSPDWFKHFSVAFCLVIEIVLPFFLWAPRRLRLLAASLLIFLQVAIAITGNYCFFNLLTIALCLLLIDDVSWRRQRGALHGGTGAVVPHSFAGDRLSICCAIAILASTLPLNAMLIYSAFKPDAEWPRPLRFVYERIERFRIVNGYGLFRVMTKDRREIVLEGSVDGIDWFPYEFKWKPGDVKRPPGWCAPHQPRLDWQMWFAALGSVQNNQWFVRTAVCLLHGNREVARLLEKNPFPNEPPRYLRASFYRYRFTTVNEKRETGAWWKRQELGEYMPPVSLRRDQ